ncbi:50S ribosomal protein L34e [Candidatus Bathyarchaeota archaeon]|nr:50S ribosomal protein L34e [Candidatus Bathyarchaeota archaeon]MBS7618987.1 50S ribosomal protein L34e [Candidatus Bathyarchaeota archaeon]
MGKNILAKPKVKVKLPSGKTIDRVKRRKSNIAYCSLCGGVLHGVRYDTVKSQKTISRLHGGKVCHNCLKRLLIKEVVLNVGQ